MHIKEISERLHYYTGGYPYLISKLCKIIDEEIVPEKINIKNTEGMDEWILKYVDEAFTMILGDEYIYNQQERMNVDGREIFIVTV